jgi:hypothetical protein
VSQSERPAEGVPYDPAGGALDFDVQVAGRFFYSEATPLSGEISISPNTIIAANPRLAVDADGRVLVCWSGLRLPAVGTTEAIDRWDIYACGLAADGSAVGEAFRLNTHLRGDQFRPVVTAFSEGFQVAWTSLAQDGAREGVFGRAATVAGPIGDEMQINTITASQQLHPTLATTDGNRVLAAWTTFTGLESSFDLVALRFAAVPALAAPQPPFAYALSQSRMAVTWPALDGFVVGAYELYIDDALSPVELTENRYFLSKLAPSSEHSFRLAYRLADGRRSPISEPASASTWDEDGNFDGLPDDWQAEHWGDASSAWAGGSVDSDGDGATNLQELLAGTDPTDPTSVLRLALEGDPQGVRLVWNAQPGSIYQVQVSSDFKGWSAVGLERLAAGSQDSILVAGEASTVMYRVVRIR